MIGDHLCREKCGMRNSSDRGRRMSGGPGIDGRS